MSATRLVPGTGQMWMRYGALPRWRAPAQRDLGLGVRRPLATHSLAGGGGFEPGASPLPTCSGAVCIVRRDVIALPRDGAAARFATRDAASLCPSVCGVTRGMPRALWPFATGCVLARVHVVRELPRRGDGHPQCSGLDSARPGRAPQQRRRDGRVRRVVLRLLRHQRCFAGCRRRAGSDANHGLDVKPKIIPGKRRASPSDAAERQIGAKRVQPLTQWGEVGRRTANPEDLDNFDSQPAVARSYRVTGAAVGLISVVVALVFLLILYLTSLTARTGCRSTRTAWRRDL